ncbi:MAG: NYN domain-containing protein [Oscillospiraceae bacterium]|nr:NYN domain-containing protein [Oscillospiraceae bacterium]
MRQYDDIRLAVLIDADNAPRRTLKEVMEEIAVYGTPTIKRIYGDWTNPRLEGWKKALLENAITPIQQYGYTVGKNATDSAMIIDAMDILYSGKVEGFCLISSDSDFTRLATRLREAGMKVIGMGEKKTPNPFIVACDKFIYIEILSGQKKKPSPKPAPAPAGEPDEKKKATAAAAPVKHPKPEPATVVPEEIIDLIAMTIDDVADDDGWAYLGEVGSLLSKKQPDFDSRNYGFKKLTLLIGVIDCFEVDFRQNVQANNGKLIYIRNRR